MNRKQKSKVGVAGNIINQLMANNNSLPKVGEGVTIILYSDRHVADVVEVSKDMKRVKIENLSAKADVTKDNQMGHQNWVFKKTGQFETLVWRYNNWYVETKQIVFTEEFANKSDEPSISMYLKKIDMDLFNDIYQGEIFPQKVVEGITTMDIIYSKTNVLFGKKDYYYDWSF